MELRNSEGGSSFNDLVQRMMFKCGVTRIGPLTNEELVNEIDASFAASSAGGIMDRKTFHEVINSNINGWIHMFVIFQAR